MQTSQHRWHRSSGREIYVECRGSGRPTVMLEAGLRNGANIWSQRSTPTQTQLPVIPALARRTRVCAYDRPGIALSFDRVSRSRQYASLHPRSVAGLVLVDAIPESIERDLSVSNWNAYNGRYFVTPPPELAGYADLE